MNWNAKLYNYFDIDAPHIRDFLKELVQQYHLENPLQVLDVGCGTRRLLPALASLGWHVTGFEPHPDYLAAASQYNSEQIQVRQAGFFEIDSHEQFHLIAAVNAPFAYLLDMPSRQDALARIFAALKPNGLFFLDIPNFLWILHQYRPPQDAILTTAEGDELRRVIKHTWDWHKSRYTHTDTFYRNGQYLTTQSHEMGIITPETLFWLIEQAGFQDIRSYRNYAKAQAAPISTGRILISAIKPL